LSDRFRDLQPTLGIDEEMEILRLSCEFSGIGSFTDKFITHVSFFVDKVASKGLQLAKMSTVAAFSRSALKQSLDSPLPLYKIVDALEAYLVDCLGLLSPLSELLLPVESSEEEMFDCVDEQLVESPTDVAAFDSATLELAHVEARTPFAPVQF